MDYSEGKVASFYDMWNYIFPCEAQIKKKLSKEDKLRLKHNHTGSIPLNSTAVSYCSSSKSTATSTSIPAVPPYSQLNSSSTLGY